MAWAKLSGSSKRRALLMPGTDLFDAASANRVGKRIERAAYQSEDVSDANLLKRLDQDIRDRLRHFAAPSL